MELTIEQALRQGIAAHKEGKIQEAERLYRAILQSQPTHPDANHNLGVLAVSVNKAEAALPFFKTALEANPKIEQFWLSYIDALIKEKQFDNAKEVLEQGKKHGVDGKRLSVLEAQLSPITQKTNPSSSSPSQEQLSSLLEYYQKGRHDDAEKLAISITEQFPEHQFGWKILGALFAQKGMKNEALNANQRSLHLAPLDAEAHNNLGNTLQALGRLAEAEACLRQAIALKPDFPEAHNSLGHTLQILGRLDEAEASLRQAITFRSEYSEAHNNMGITLNELGRLEEAEASLRKAIALKSDFIEAFWNLSGMEKTIQGAEHWVDKCLMVDTNYLPAKLTKAALRFYQGDGDDFDNLMKSEFKQHSYMRSFSWAFSLPNIPDLYFNRWYFFDAIVKKSIRSRPFYEFGVWKGEAFKYLIKSFKKGYGFDTFSGLPEDWHSGNRIEPSGAYTSDGNVPDIKGAEFIVGKFEDTLPIFYSKSRPLASVINFDADLYSSTLCALNYSKPVMDKHTVLIFDEFIINESWEQDEFKALTEFASINNYTYEVIAISFFTKQVAVKLIGI